ncbi:hypothetical protein ACYSNR_02070 [Enterococcus sp. LJL128]
MVVVETRFGYSVAEFIEYVKQPFSKEVQSFIVQKVDISEIESEKERLVKISILRSEINEKAKAALQRRKLNELAAEDAELKALLDTLDSLES